jgi:hypothetical protein
VYRAGHIQAFNWLHGCYPALDLRWYVELQLKVSATCEELPKDGLDRAYWNAVQAWYTNGALGELSNFFKADKKDKLPGKAHRRASAAESTQYNRLHRNNIGRSRPVLNFTSSAPIDRVPSPREPELPDAAPLLSGAGLLEHPSTTSNQPEDAPAPVVELTRRLRNCPLWVSRDLEKKGMSCYETLTTSSLRPSFAVCVCTRL